MKKILIALSVLSVIGTSEAGRRYATDTQWEACIEKHEHRLHKQGMCGASACFDEGHHQPGDLCIAEVGYPKISETELQTAIQEIKQGDTSNIMSGTVSVVPPGHEIHKVWAEAKAAQAAENAKWERSRKPDIRIKTRIDATSDIFINR